MFKKSKNKINSKIPKKLKNKNNRRVYYSFLTFVLFVCLIQMGISAFLNISKCIINQARVKKMQDYKIKVISENTRLKNDFNNFNSLKSLEAIARNNLKMSSDDEVLVIINQPKKINEPETSEKNYKKILNNVVDHKKLIKKP